MNKDVEEIFNKLNKSEFRSSFHLKEPDLIYINNKGLDKIRLHAHDFVKKRLSGANIPNDGKQTPTKGHPVFIAQHATATCCRGCLSKLHNIPEKTKLTKDQIEYIVDIIMTWITNEMSKK